jgi:hypothetical protein
MIHVPLRRHQGRASDCLHLLLRIIQVDSIAIVSDFRGENLWAVV